MSSPRGEGVDWLALEAQFPENSAGAELGVRAAARNPIVRMMVEAQELKIVEWPHEDWEWLGKVMAAGYRISRDGAAEAIAMSEQAFRSQKNKGRV